MKEILLFIIAIVLFIAIAPLGFLFELLFNLKYFLEYLHILAVSIDQTGGVWCKSLFNFIFIKKEGHKFGLPDETISSVLGKNYKNNNLTLLGKLLNSLLNTKSNHTIESIEEDEQH